MDQLARLEALEAENGRLRDRIAELEENFGLSIEMPVFLGLTGSEARIFGALLKRPAMTKDQIHSVLYALRPDGDGAEMKIVDVFIHKLRRKLKPMDVTIETIWGQGYRILPDVRERALAAIAQRSAR